MQVDAYLAGKVAAGHKAATNFALDLLDYFVLPPLSGYSHGAPVPTTEMASLAGSAAAGVATFPVVPSKREFTVLNEYDLWLTIQGLYHQYQATMSTVDNTRLRFSCARLRALLDLGLLGEPPVTRFFGPGTPEAAALFVGCSRAREFDDTALMKNKTETFFLEWIEAYKVNSGTAPRGVGSGGTQPTSSQALSTSPGGVGGGNMATSAAGDTPNYDWAITMLNNLGLLANDECITRFFRLATIYVVEKTVNNLKASEHQPQANYAPLSRIGSYVELDAYARIISILLHRTGSHLDNPKEANSARVSQIFFHCNEDVDDEE